MIFVGIGVSLVFITHRLDYRIYANLSRALLIISAILLLYTILQSDDNEVNNAKRWIFIFNQSFQPSDLAKFSLIIYLAQVLTKKQHLLKDFWKGFVPIITWVVAICGLIAYADLGTATLLFFSSLILMFVAGVEMKHMGQVIGAGIVMLLLLFQLSPRSNTWKTRVEDYVDSFFDEDYKPEYQILHSNIAIANGGFTGKGPGKSIERNFLPSAYSDFIFSIIIEEYGFLGGAFVLFLYIVLLIRGIAVITNSKTFGALLTTGLLFLIVFQAFINISVAIGLIPVTGLPLPLLSQGGTSTLFTSISLGIILSVSRKVIKDANSEKDATLKI